MAWTWDSRRHQSVPFDRLLCIGDLMAQALHDNPDVKDVRAAILLQDDEHGSIVLVHYDDEDEGQAAADLSVHLEELVTSRPGQLVVRRDRE